MLRLQDDLGLAHVAIGVATGGWSDRDCFPLMVMQSLLGNFNRSQAAGVNMASTLCRVRLCSLLLCRVVVSPLSIDVSALPCPCSPSMHTLCTQKVAEDQLAHSFSTFNTTYKVRAVGGW